MLVHEADVIVQFIRKVDGLSSLSVATLASIADKMWTEQHVAGETIIRQGDLSKQLYVVRQGEVEVLPRRTVNRGSSQRWAKEIVLARTCRQKLASHRHRANDETDAALCARRKRFPRGAAGERIAPRGAAQGVVRAAMSQGSMLCGLRPAGGIYQHGRCPPPQSNRRRKSAFDRQLPFQLAQLHRGDLPFDHIVKQVLPRRQQIERCFAGVEAGRRRRFRPPPQGLAVLLQKLNAATRQIDLGQSA